MRRHTVVRLPLYMRSIAGVHRRVGEPAEGCIGNADQEARIWCSLCHMQNIHIQVGLIARSKPTCGRGRQVGRISRRYWTRATARDASLANLQILDPGPMCILRVRKFGILEAQELRDLN